MPTSAHTTELANAVAALRAGAVIGLPTETVYGLAADALNPAAVAHIFALKVRPLNHPLIVHIAGIEMLPRFARAIPDSSRQLAAALWPGPLTLLLPRHAHLPTPLTAGPASLGPH